MSASLDFCCYCWRPSTYTRPTGAHGLSPRKWASVCLPQHSNQRLRNLQRDPGRCLAFSSFKNRWHGPCDALIQDRNKRGCGNFADAAGFGPSVFPVNRGLLRCEPNCMLFICGCCCEPCPPGTGLCGHHHESCEGLPGRTRAP